LESVYFNRESCWVDIERNINQRRRRKITFFELPDNLVQLFGSHSKICHNPFKVLGNDKCKNKLGSSWKQRTSFSVWERLQIRSSFRGNPLVLGFILPKSHSFPDTSMGNKRNREFCAIIVSVHWLSQGIHISCQICFLAVTLTTDSALWKPRFHDMTPQYLFSCSEAL
jgi:hypothetical protein